MKQESVARDGVELENLGEEKGRSLVCLFALKSEDGGQEDDSTENQRVLQTGCKYVCSFESHPLFESALN